MRARLGVMLLISNYSVERVTATLSIKEHHFITVYRCMATPTELIWIRG